MSGKTIPFRRAALANVTPLRPIKVLLDGRDRRYARAMQFLLAGRGYDVKRCTTPAKLLAGVDAYAPDVVILVEGRSFADTVGLAVSIVGRSEAASVIVATSRPDAPSGRRLRFVEKWCAFEVLADEVEKAWADTPRSGKNVQSVLAASRARPKTPRS
jgi:FixJ family two-component response regulator